MIDKPALTHSAPPAAEALSASDKKSAELKLASAGSVFHVHDVSKILPHGAKSRCMRCAMSLLICIRANSPCCWALPAVANPPCSIFSAVSTAPPSGDVYYRDHNLTRADEDGLTRFRREHVGFVFQFYNLIPVLPRLRTSPWSPKIAEHPLDPAEALDLVASATGATISRRNCRAASSSAWRLRAPWPSARCAAVRRATGALDYATGKIVLEVLARVNRELGTITAVITHNAAIAGMADRVIRISSGEIVEVRLNEKKLARGIFPGEPFNKILWRDFWHLRGQVIAAAMVVACGVMAQVSNEQRLYFVAECAGQLLQRLSLCGCVRKS